MAYKLSLEEAEFQEYDIIKIYNTSIIHVVLNQTKPIHPIAREIEFLVFFFHACCLGGEDSRDCYYSPYSIIIYFKLNYLDSRYVFNVNSISNPYNQKRV